MSLKEGNPFEDIALVDALHSLTHKIYDQQQHIHDVLKAIIDLELSNPLGYELQNEYETSLNAVNSALDKIWIPEMMVSDEVKIDQFTDLVKLQNEQHYAMISKFPSDISPNLSSKFSNKTFLFVSRATSTSQAFCSR